MDQVGVVLLELSGVVAVVPLAMAWLDLLAVWPDEGFLAVHVRARLWIVRGRCDVAVRLVPIVALICLEGYWAARMPARSVRLRRRPLGLLVRVRGRVRVLAVRVCRSRGPWWASVVVHSCPRLRPRPVDGERERKGGRQW